MGHHNFFNQLKDMGGHNGTTRLGIPKEKKSIKT